MRDWPWMIDKRAPTLPSLPATIGAATSELTQDIDRWLHAQAARFTHGLSPAALIGAYLDWSTHLAFSPGKRVELAMQASRDLARFTMFAWRAALFAGDDKVIEPLPQDRRFAADGWGTWPFKLIYQAFLLQEQWWHAATTGVGGVTAPARGRHRVHGAPDARHRGAVQLPPDQPGGARPHASKTGGTNLFAGWANLIEDWQRALTGAPPAGAERFVVGKDVAVTPGKVVYRNRLIELIQYAPTTAKVRPEPILIVPAWIMKYYILDLSPENSLVRYLVGAASPSSSFRGRTPTRRPRSRPRRLSRPSASRRRSMRSQRSSPAGKVHALGYCLGGTLLSIAAADDGARRRRPARLDDAIRRRDRLHRCRRNPAVHQREPDRFLDDMMWETGFLDAQHMAGPSRCSAPTTSSGRAWSTTT